MAHGFVSVPAILFMIGAPLSGVILFMVLVASFTLSSEDAVERKAIVRQQAVLAVSAAVWLEILAIGIKTIWG